VHTCRAYLRSRAAARQPGGSKKSPATAGLFSSKPVLPIAATVLAALAAGFGRPFPIFREVSRATLMPTMGLTALVAAAGMAAVALFATLAPGLSRELMIFREAALFGRHAVPALASGSAARSGSFANFPPLASPPLLAMSRCSFSSVDAKPRFEVWNWSRSAIIIPRNCRVFITDSTLMTGDFIIKQSMIHVVPSILSKNWIGMKVTLLDSRYRLAVRRTLLRQVRTQRHLDRNGLALFPHHLSGFLSDGCLPSLATAIFAAGWLSLVKAG
jgi:hypothetical protein